MMESLQKELDALVDEVAPPLIDPGVPGGGVLKNVHCSPPVSGSNDLRMPGRLSKSPETPTMRWLRTMSGAFVDQ